MRYRKNISVKGVTGQTQPTRQAPLQRVTHAAKRGLRPVNHQCLDVLQKPLANLGPLIYGALQVVDMDSERGSSNQRDRLMCRDF